MKHIHLFASLLLIVSVATFSTQASTAAIHDHHLNFKSADGKIVDGDNKEVKQSAPSAPGHYAQAPARVDATNSNMKILTLAEAQAITFNWTDAQGVQHTSSIADPATDPHHIAALLREIYINRKVPGIKKVGYSSADVTTPDSGPVTYIITDDNLDNQNWSTWERRYLATERNNENHKVRTIYNIPVTQQAYRYDNPTGYYFDDYMPEDEGYTTLLVKTKHDIINIGSPSTYDELIDGISKNIEEVVLLTQGKYYAKGDGIGKSGALYKTSGTASSFYFISKGKARRNTGTGRTWSFAPFFGLYEEYSPEIVNSSTQTTDVWVKMKNGNDYKVQHDCGSVIILNHQFNMADREEATRSTTWSSLSPTGDWRTGTIETR